MNTTVGKIVGKMTRGEWGLVHEFVPADEERLVNYGRLVVVVELKVTDVIRSFFKPEFLNRLDNIVIFNPLSEPMMKAIITLQLKAVETRLDKQGYRFKAQDSLEKYLLSEGFDTLYGARPLKRVINEHILDEIALQIVEGKVQKGDLLTAGVKAGKVTIEAKRVN
jgi:ATP-dependent Clp protease ATP-binding subunit ClpB